MGKKYIMDECKICGKIKKLTFEHVPPEITFNNHAVKVVTGDALLNKNTENERLPWELQNLNYNNQQRGRGGYYLCEECNSKTGSWYVPFFRDFIHGFHSLLKQYKQKDFNAMHVIAKDIKPLAILKQIMVMFCDINKGCMGDISLREFLLDKNSVNFNKDKFRLFAYLQDGKLERMNGISTMFISGVGAITITEISSYPLGFALYINLPDNYTPRGVELTSFADFNYEDICEVEVIIPKLENNTFFSGDYRTKEEIINCIEKNRLWEEEHQEEI